MPIPTASNFDEEELNASLAHANHYLLGLEELPGLDPVTAYAQAYAALRMEGCTEEEAIRTCHRMDRAFRPLARIARNRAMESNGCTEAEAQLLVATALADYFTRHIRWGGPSTTEEKSEDKYGTG